MLNVNGVVALNGMRSSWILIAMSLKTPGIPYDARSRAGGDQIVTRVILV